MTVPTWQRCPKCHQVSPVGTRYCPTCGEPLDPALAAEVYELYATLRDLDARLAAGKGGESIQQLRDAYRTRYLEQHPNATTPEQILEQRWLYRALLDLDARLTASGGALTVAALREAYLARYLAIRAGPTAVERRAPTGPAFSWEAFLQEGAIALMAYLGGFLLVVAAFTLTVGSWTGLSDATKVVLVVGVHILFLVLGLVLRGTRRSSLRTVGNAYLAVFALLLPVVALAIYRFALQNVSVPLAGIICVAAGYGVVIYLLLAWHTRQAAYGYLAGAALLVALEAGLGWSGLPSEWWIAVLGLGALALLLPSVPRLAGDGAALARTARQVSLAATIVAGASAFVLGAVVTLSDLTGGSGTSSVHWNLVLLVTWGILLALGVGWSAAVRRGQRRGDAWSLNAADLGTAVALAAVVFSAAVWAQATLVALAYDLAGMACCWLLGLVVLRALQPARTGLRHGLAAMASGMALLGAALVAINSTPNWPLAACLSVGVVVGVVAAAASRAPWWLLGAGLFLLADFAEAVAQLERSPLATRLYAFEPALTFPSTYYAGLALVLCLAVIALSARERLRAYGLPLYVVALVGALLTTFLIPFGVALGAARAAPTADYAALVLSVLALGVLIAGWRARLTVLAEIAFVYLGLLLPLPYLLLENREELPLVALAVGCAVVALAVRRVLGRAWAYAPYAVALYVIALAALKATDPRVSTAGWALLGVSFATSVLLAGAALATLAAWWETHPLAMVAPAGLALLAAALNRDALGQGVVVLAIVYAGLLVSWRRGRGWGWAWYAAAVPASLLAAGALDASPIYGAWGAAILLLGLAALSEVVALAEGAAWVGAGLVAYGAAALAVAPAGGQMAFAASVTGAAVALGIAMRLGVARRLRRTTGRVALSRDVLPWSAPWYGLAAAGSIATVLRSGVAPGALPLVLLGLAGLAYLVALVERSAWITTLAVIYGIWAAAVLPGVPGADPLVLTIALALGAGLLGAAIRLRARREWVLALYAIGVGASLLSLGRVVPYDTTTVEAVLLLYALAACLVVAAERHALAGIAPALYAAGAVVIQPDARLLLPVALVAGIIGLGLRLRLNFRWALPWYVLALVAGVVTPLRAVDRPGFEPVVLLALALLVYAAAVIEEHAWVLVPAFALAAASLLAQLIHVEASLAGSILAFVALSYVLAAGRWLWLAVLPHPAEPAAAPGQPAPHAAPHPARQPRSQGAAVHGWSAIVVAGVTALVPFMVPFMYTAHDPLLLSGAVALWGLGGLMVLHERHSQARALLYLAALAVAFSTLWLTGWLGITNVQAYTLVPGLALIGIGTLLPRDKRLGYPVGWGTAATLIGAVLVLLPTFSQSFVPGQEAGYLALLVLEALALVAIGLGSGARPLVFVGAGAVGVGALRGAALALALGVPVFLLIATLALLLLAGATWLGLRTHPSDEGNEPRTPAGPQG